MYRNVIVKQYKDMTKVYITLQNTT